MFKRVRENPLLRPDIENIWEANAVFNPCVVHAEDRYHMLYRAMSAPYFIQNVHISISSIGYAISDDGINFHRIKQLIKPEYSWEAFGCEDPRATKFEGKYYVFYTALSEYPFTPNGIKIGLAKFDNFDSPPIKHSVTNFNSKAMALFPQRVAGKIAAVLTVHTDIPPAKIALALFDKEEDIVSSQYWNDWYAFLNYHVIPLLRDSQDHIELGAPPIRTDYGWLLIYSYIHNYFSSNKIFSIEIALLDLNDPRKVIGRINEPLLVPNESYELDGNVPNVIFPSGAIVDQGNIIIYYGGADTVCCAAIYDIDILLKKLIVDDKNLFVQSNAVPLVSRYKYNPIIAPRPEFFWEAKATFNPAAIYENEKIHIIYRAMSHDDVSVLGYATSRDGIHIDERLQDPIYVPTEFYEKRLIPGNSGCEDPRITRIDDKFYVFYTAYDGFIPRVAYTSILVRDFLDRNWNWERSKVITPRHISDKDACLLPKKFNGKYVVFHRVDNTIYLDYLNSLAYLETAWLLNEYKIIDVNCRKDKQLVKTGIAAPPIETEKGWLMFFHCVTTRDGNNSYEAGMLLLDYNDPSKVISPSVHLLEPEMVYEKIGIVSNVVFPCGAVLLEEDILLYYGGADRVVGVAKLRLSDALQMLGNS